MTDDDDYAAMLAEVRAELPERTLATFDHDDARLLGTAAASIAQQKDHPVIISVFRSGQLVFQTAFAGTTAEHEDWVRRKKNTAMQHEIPSLEFLLRQRLAGRSPDWLDPREFAVAGGAVPIRVGGHVVGAIVVSGLVGSVRADHDLAMAALRATAEVVQ